ncbi:hypothetical protein A9Q98_03380 [Thalassotalea sp. 42_200_T64]|nr:hypothetical protein A9Q98_03380 [Thalassotalea sp. 42_200_T64]
MLSFLELKIPPLLLFFVFAVLMTQVPIAITNLSIAFAYNNLLALIIAIFGVIVVATGVINFKKADTTVDPRTPEQVNELVVSGVYQYSRNPMYLGFALMLLALAIYLQTIASYIWVIIFCRYLYHFQIMPEERALEKLFGQSYTDYCQKVRRWI